MSAFENIPLANIQSSIVSDITRDQVKDLSDVFIVPFNVHTGVQNITNGGTQPQNARPDNYVEFNKVFTGKAAVIAQWDKAIDLRPRRERNNYGYDDLSVFRNPKYDDHEDVVVDDKGNFQYEWDMEDVNKALISGKTTIQYNENTYLWNGKIFEYNGLALTLDEVLDILNNDDTITINRNVDLDKVSPFLNCLYKTFRVGTYFKGQFISSNNSGTFDNMPSDDETGTFIQEAAIREITVRVLKRISKDDLFKFYWAPQYFNSQPEDANGLSEDVQWLYISSANEIKSPTGEYICTELTLSSVNDKLNKTGQSINSYIQYSSLGEGACLPSLIYDSTQKAIGIKINPTMIKDNGINTIQIEQIGVAATTSPLVMGRPIEKVGKFNNRVWPSRDLLMSDIKIPVPDQLNRQNNPSTKFFLANFLPEIESYYKSWVESRKADWTDQIIKQFDGWMESNHATVNGSNPLLKDINDTTWYVDILDIDYDTTGNYAFNYTVNSKTGKSETETINIKKSQVSNVVDLMNLFRYMFSHILTIPLTSKQQISWNLDQMPIIGPFLNKWTFGLPIGWRKINTNTDANYPQFRGIPTFMDADIYNWYSNAFWSDGQINAIGQENGGAVKNSGRIPFDAFRSATNTKIGGLIGNQSNSTAWMFRLTDRAKLEEVNAQTGETTNNMVECSTIMLGQQNQNDNTKAYIYSPNSKSVDSSSTNDYVSDIVIHQKGQVPQNYIVDAIGIMALHDGDIRITAFDRDPDLEDYRYHTVFQTTIMSQAEWTKNIRNWLTLYKTSYLDDFIPDDVSFNWPAAMPEPVPESSVKAFDRVINLSPFAIDYNTTVSNKSNSDNTVAKYDVPTNLKNYELFDFKSVGLNTTEEIQRNFANITFSINYKVATMLANSSGFNITDWPAGDEANKDVNVNISDITNEYTIYSFLQKTYTGTTFPMPDDRVAAAITHTIHLDGTKLMMSLTGTATSVADGSLTQRVNADLNFHVAPKTSLTIHAKH